VTTLLGITSDGFCTTTTLNWDTLAINACQKLQPSATDCTNALLTRSLAGITFSGPLVITQGGTYTGHWQSANPAVAAVTINTSEPVNIENSVIVSAGNLIYGRNINGTISNVTGFGTGAKIGKFLDATVGSSLSITGNRMSNVWGIRISGASAGASAQITIENNIGYNMVNDIGDAAHFIQLVNGIFPGATISGNVAIDAPFKSNVEDVINLYNARGTSANHIAVKNNTIMGAYPLNASGGSYSGGGIIADGSGSATTATASAYINIANNTVIDTTNYGVAIASGNNNTLTNNVVVSSGILNGTTPVQAQNIGMYVWNVNKQSPTAFFNDSAFGNQVFWMKVSNSEVARQSTNDWWLPDCKSTAIGGCTNSTLSNTRNLNAGMQLESNYISKYFPGE
jgi:hypothetical protein